MGFLESSETVDAARLRERNVPQQARNDEEARAAVLELNAKEEEEQKCEKDKKTFGRTPDGIGNDHTQIQFSANRSIESTFQVSLFANVLFL